MGHVLLYSCCEDVRVYSCTCHVLLRWDTVQTTESGRDISDGTSNEMLVWLRTVITILRRTWHGLETWVDIGIIYRTMESQPWWQTWVDIDSIADGEMKTEPGQGNRNYNRPPARHLERRRGNNQADHPWHLKTSQTMFVLFDPVIVWFVRTHWARLTTTDFIPRRHLVHTVRPSHLVSQFSIVSNFVSCCCLQLPSWYMFIST